MKHLLIILISIFLLSSTVIGQETGVLYLYESSSGFVLKSFGDGKVQPKYKGEITNGEPNGFGVLTYPYGEKSVVGEWKNGKEWNTKHTKKDGTLLGKFENGEWIVSLGVLYLGKRNGKIGYYTEKWEGVESEDNRDFSKYEGEIKNGKPNGQGESTFPDGRKYVGEFKNGYWNGQGTETSPDGEKYVGEFKDGERNGQGIETSPDGTKYVEEFKNGFPNGQGTMTLPNGNKYVGKWKDGFPNGQGTETFSNGGKYVGEWKNGKKHSQGTQTFPDGSKYVGEWKDGLLHGQGTLTFPDGGKYVGEFKDGKRWKGTEYDKYGNIVVKFVDGLRQY